MTRAAPRARHEEVVLDLGAQTIARGDVVLPIVAKQDPVTPGFVAVKGSVALVTAHAAPHADPRLMRVDFAARTVERVAGFEGPGWIAGGWFGDKMIVAEQRLGAAPKFSLRTDRVLFESTGTQPAVVPVAWRAFVLTVLSPEVDAVTGVGPTWLVAIDPTSRAMRALVEVEPGPLEVDGDVIAIHRPREDVLVTLAS